LGLTPHVHTICTLRVRVCHQLSDMLTTMAYIFATELCWPSILQQIGAAWLHTGGLQGSSNKCSDVKNSTYLSYSCNACIHDQHTGGVEREIPGTNKTQCVNIALWFDNLLSDFIMYF
jgi:hypothetical protein